MTELSLIQNPIRETTIPKSHEHKKLSDVNTHVYIEQKKNYLNTDININTKNYQTVSNRSRLLPFSFDDLRYRISSYYHFKMKFLPFPFLRYLNKHCYTSQYN